MFQCVEAEVNGDKINLESHADPRTTSKYTELVIDNTKMKEHNNMIL